jgi:hypothetical protein
MGTAPMFTGDFQAVKDRAVTYNLLQMGHLDNLIAPPS